MKFIAIFQLLLLSGAAFASNTKQSPNNEFATNGFFAPVYGQVSAVANSEIHSEASDPRTALEAQLGTQLIRRGEHSVIIGAVKRGFHHAHTSKNEYKYDLLGPVLEYMYTGFEFRPHIQINYMTGEERYNDEDNSERQYAREISRSEINIGTGYRGSKDIEGLGSVGARVFEKAQDIIVQDERLVSRKTSGEVFNRDRVVFSLGVRFTNF